MTSKWIKGSRGEAHKQGNLFSLFSEPRRGQGRRIGKSKMLQKLSLNNYWLAGFTQADGCFHISVAKSQTHKTGYSVRL